LRRRGPTDNPRQDPEATHEHRPYGRRNPADPAAAGFTSWDACCSWRRATSVLFRHPSRRRRARADGDRGTVHVRELPARRHAWDGLPGLGGVHERRRGAAIRADATGTFYVSSELGLSAARSPGSPPTAACITRRWNRRTRSPRRSGSGAWGRRHGLEHRTAGERQRHLQRLRGEPSLANVTVSTSQDGGATWTKNVVSATIPGDDREWIAADQTTKVCVSYHDVVTFNIDVNCSFDAGASFTQVGSAIDVAHAFLIDDNEIGNLTIDPNSHVVYQAFSGIATATRRSSGVFPCRLDRGLARRRSDVHRTIPST